MSRRVEFEGKNVDQAVEKACKSTRTSKDELKYDVISYGSTGIFGLVGSRKAKIRVWVSENPGKSVVKAEQKQRGDGDLPLPEDDSVVKSQKIDETRAPLMDEELVNLGKEVLGRIINLITSNAEIETVVNSGQVQYHIKGGNPGLLIGKRGQTLESIQYIVEKVVNRRVGKRIRIEVDVEGYLENRRNNLIRLAERLSEKVKRTGKPVTIGQMNAYERRIVHMALRDEKGVRTQSKGDGLIKKIAIFPGKTQNRKRK